MMQDIITAIIVFAITFPVSYGYGRKNERDKNHRDIVSQRAAGLVSLIRETSDEAQSYYVVEHPDRERLSYSVLLGSKLSRISTDLHQLGRLVERPMGFSAVWLDFYRAVTEDPFAQEGFAVLAPDDPRIQEIQIAEGGLIDAVRRTEEAL